MRYCSTWLRLLLCYIKKFVIEEFVIRVVSCLGVLQQIKCCSTPRQDTTITTPLYIGMYVICYIYRPHFCIHVHTYAYSVFPPEKNEGGEGVTMNVLMYNYQYYFNT